MDGRYPSALSVKLPSKFCLFLKFLYECSSQHLRRSSSLEMKYTMVLVRHGESTWNNENKFTGWVDCPLSEEGLKEAVDGAKLLQEEGFTFDIAYTSVLKRAIKTLWIILEELDLMYIPIVSL